MSHDKQHTIALMAATLLADPSRTCDGIEQVAHCADVAIQTYEVVEVLLTKRAVEMADAKVAADGGPF